jgi:hypothetical protein
MSADNWAVCPKCVKLANVKAAEQVTAVKESYGKVPEQEYTAALLALDKLPKTPADIGENFREDYEIYGAESGVITVSYSGHCSRCGLGLDFEITKYLYGD